ncbi:MAG: hypothetical protein K2L96_08745 [Muribaculaceae bacterium]|nr:hypothetical protein [Muribaculaceae bacterium]
MSAYTSVPFSELNASKVGRVVYLVLFEGDGPVAGIILGRWDDNAPYRSPFSAPFGGMDMARKMRIEEVCEAYRLIREYCGASGMHITLPPPQYAPAFVAQHTYALDALAVRRELWLNHLYELGPERPFESLVSEKMRQHLRRAWRSGYETDFNPSIEEAYEVIRQNRLERGYPLAMSLDDLKATASIIQQEYIVLRHEGRAVAASISYRVAPGVLQLIYWGHLSECRGKYPMVALADALYSHALAEGFDVLDLGPSTCVSSPNDSLADFKESVGAQASLKFVFQL